MSDADDGPSRCHSCGAPLWGTTSVEVSILSGDSERSTALCEGCATVSCASCGHEVPITSALADRGDIWESVTLHECAKCGASVPNTDVVELHHENDPNYRKLLCSECLKETPIPSNIRIVRDVS